MPFLSLMILGLLAWYFTRKVITSKSQERQLLEARICLLERDVQMLKKQAHPL